jgi:hypothetical protein
MTSQQHYKMNKFKLTLSVMISMMCAPFVSFAQQPAPQKQLYPTVLIELFSSEGCSSCPAADEFLQELIARADSSRAPVFCLDYHVDIWNRTGWVDRFSDTSFSRRQREYMVKNGQHALFTPMMFVNGGGALPGAAKKEVATLINRNMSTLPKAILETKAGYIPGTHTLVVDYAITGEADSCSIHFVLAYKAIKSEVTAGENAGKTLVHHHTAKLWKQVDIDPSKKGKVSIALPEDVPLSNLMLVSFVQHDPSWKVYATDQLEFR